MPRDDRTQQERLHDKHGAPNGNGRQQDAQRTGPKGEPLKPGEPRR